MVDPRAAVSTSTARAACSSSSSEGTPVDCRGHVCLDPRPCRPPQRRSPLPQRRSPLRGRHRGGRGAGRLVCPVPSRPRQDRVDRCRRRPPGARRRGGVHRRRPRPAAVPGRRAALARPRLAAGVVRYVGEPLAVVVAESAAAAVDARELVDVDYEPLPAVVDPIAATEEGAPLLFPDHGSNVVSDGGAADEDPLEGADVVVRARLVNQRVAPVPLEPNAALAVPEPGGGLTIYASTQSPFGVRREVASALGLEEEAVRVVAPDVGGGFGAKGGAYPEQIVVAALAHRLGRPVRWAETRSENLVGMTHGRAQVQDVELGARRDGTIVGLRARALTDVGAYSWRGTFLPGVTRVMASGVYRIPRIAFRPMAVVTNTTPTGPYRGAGRPEAAALLERSMDLLAAELGMDPVEIRRRNFISPDQFPYQSPTGASYDSGDYAKALDRALELVGYQELRAEQRARVEDRKSTRLNSQSRGQ